jgi:hypothetical protein
MLDDIRARFWTTEVVTAIVGQLRGSDRDLRTLSVKFIVEAAKYGKFGSGGKGSSYLTIQQRMVIESRQW